MSSRLADPLYHRLRRAFPPGASYARSDWDDEAMPAVVQQFLEHRLRQHSRREVRRLRRARTDWVDYDHPEMEAAVRTFFDAVATHTRVPANEWDDTLRHAVDYVTAYLVRPVPVLVEFVFGDQEGPVALDAVRQRMQFFRPYAYLREAVRAYAQKRDAEAIDRDTFASVLRRVDKGIATDFDADRWLQLLRPLFEAGTHAFGQERLPVPLLRTFFQEKGQDRLAQRLAEHAEGGPDEITPEALADLISTSDRAAPSEVTTGPDASAPASPSSDPFGDPPRAPDEAAPPDVWGVSRPAQSEEETAPAPDEASDRDEPLWKQFQRGQNGTSRADTAEDNQDRSTPRWARFRQERSRRADQIANASERSASSSPRSTNEPNPTGPGAASSEEPSPRPQSEESSPPDALSTSSSAPASADGELAAVEREVLGVEHPSHRERYVEELFGGDLSAYRQVLRRLRTADSWSEASDIIASDIFRAHKVNIYSDAAVHFTNTVEARFKEGA
ncbi:MAG: hypothetical protein ACLFTE_04495 [Salinivenus sp.]